LAAAARLLKSSLDSVPTPCRPDRLKSAPSSPIADRQSALIIGIGTPKQSVVKTRRQWALLH